MATSRALTPQSPPDQWPDLALQDGVLVRGRWLAPGKFLREPMPHAADDAMEARQDFERDMGNSTNRDWHS